MSIRVLVADDQPLYRQGVGMLLEAEDDLELVGEAASGDEAVALATTSGADVVLMDVRMPRLDGIVATERLLASSASARVIVVTTFRPDEVVLRAIRAGASGFLTKDARPELVLASIRAVADGQSVIAPSATFDLLRRFGHPVAPARVELLDGLSAREKEVFLLMAKGLSNAEIATVSFVEETTVKSHVGSILAKLRLRSRAQVIAFAWENGLVAGARSTPGSGSGSSPA